MTDQELIDLLQSQLPEDLTAEQVALLQARWKQSPALRKALVVELQLEGGLATALAPPGDFAALLRRLEQRAAPRPAQRWVLTFIAGLLLLGLAGGVATWTWWRANHRPPMQVAREMVEPPLDAATTAPADSGGGDEATTQPSEDPVTEAALADLATPLSPLEADWLLYQPALPRGDLSWASAADRLLKPALPRSPETGWLKLQGTHTLLALPNESRLLRLGLGGLKTRVQLEMWSGTAGVRLDFARPGEAVGYVLSRSPAATHPAAGAQATDPPRRWADSAGRFAVDTRRQNHVDIRWHAGQVVVARGELVLLTLPLAQPPTEGNLRGDGLLTTVRLVRCLPLDSAPDNPPGRMVIDSNRPTELEWATEPAKAGALDKSPNGAVEMGGGAPGSNGPTQVMLPIKPARGTQVVLHTPTLPTGSALAVQPEAGGAPLLFRIVEYRGSRVLTLTGGGDEAKRRFEEGWTIGQGLWWRVDSGLTSLRVRIGHDGQSWALFYENDAITASPAAGVGLSAPLGASAAPLRLDRVIIRRFDAIERLADATLTARVPSLPARLPVNSADWLALCDASRPAEVPADRWRAACLAAALARPMKNDSCRAVESELFRLAPRASDDLPGLLDVLREFPYRDSLGSEPFDPAMVEAVYDAVARAAVRGGRPDLLPQLFDLWLRQERPTGIVWHRQVYCLPPELVRQCLLRLIDARDWDGLLKYSRQAASECQYEGHQDYPPPDLGFQDFVHWAALYAWERLPAPPPGVARGDWTAWTPLLAVPHESEASNALAEIRAAAGNQAYELACRLLTQADLPDQLAAVEGDPHRFRPVYAQIKELIDRDATLKKTLREQFAPLGALRLEQATAAGNTAALPGIAAQFQGTPAAAAALEQLANRDLSLGYFYSAAARYGRLLSEYGVEQSAAIAAKRRLALAMAGETSGQPIQAPVRLDGMVFSPRDFEELIAQIIAERRDLSAGNSGVTALPPAPAPVELALTLLAKSRAPAPGLSAELKRSRADLALTLVGDRLYLHRAGRLTAFALPGGWELWSHEYPLAGNPCLENGPGRPLVIGNAIFATMLSGRSAALVCLDPADGKVRWQQTYDDAVLSDPIAVGAWLYVLTSRRLRGDQAVLVLHRIRPATGESVLAAPLAEVRDRPAPWNAGRPLRAGDALIFRAAGAILCVDQLGELRWIRTLSVMPSDRDLAWSVDHRLSDLYLAGDNVITSDPRSPQVTAIDLRTGAEVWSYTAPRLRHVVGTSGGGGKVVLTTDTSIEALDAATGRRLWQTALTTQPDAVLLAEGDTVVAVSMPSSDPLSPRERAGVRASSPSGEGVPPAGEATWLSLATGQAIKSIPISGDASLADIRALTTDGRRLAGVANFHFPAGEGQVIVLEPKGK